LFKVIIFIFHNLEKVAVRRTARSIKKHWLEFIRRTNRQIGKTAGARIGLVEKRE